MSLPGVPTSSRVAASTASAASEQQPPQPFKETKPEAIPLTVMKLQTRAEASIASEAAATEAVILVAKIIPAPCSSSLSSLSLQICALPQTSKVVDKWVHFKLYFLMCIM